MFKETGKLLIAGPCALESKEQAIRIATFLKKQNVDILRFGCWKGQNHPYVGLKPAYWGLGGEALEILSHIQARYDIPCVTEVQCKEHVRDAFNIGLRYFQVGARHMQNFPLLRYLEEITRNTDRKIILKRGLGNTIDEWIGSAEHLGGHDRVILCERGISSFDRTDKTRWRLDFVGVAHVKQYTRYSIIMDPSHGSGDRSLVYALSKAALQIADGLMVEVHYEPDLSPTDAKQTIDFNEFGKIGRLYEEKKSNNKRKA